MRQAGVLVISHGSPDNDWVVLVDEAVRAVRPPASVPVVACFLEAVEGRLIQDGIDELEARGVTDIAAVPFFLSSGSTHVDELGYALGAKPEPMLPTELKPFRRRSRLLFGEPMNDEPEIVEALWAKVRELSVRPEREALLLVGHGSEEPGFAEAWQGCLERLAAELGRLGGFAVVETATMLPDTLAERMSRCREGDPEREVLVAPFFLSEGYFTRRMLPGRLKGFAYRYSGKTLLPHPAVSRWLERRIAEMLQAMEAGEDSAARR